MKTAYNTAHSRQDCFRLNLPKGASIWKWQGEKSPHSRCRDRAWV